LNPAGAHAAHGKIATACRTRRAFFQEDPMLQSIPSDQIKTIIFACEAGMGSSLMSVNSLKKKLKAAGVAGISVVHLPAREIPADAQLVVIHKNLADVARSKAPNAVVVTFKTFLNDPVFDQLVKSLVDHSEVVASV
jgi:mannitol-specific phosphotransferase system IIBC component